MNQPPAAESADAPIAPPQEWGMLCVVLGIVALMGAFAVAWWVISSKTQRGPSWIDPGQVENKKAAQMVPSVGWTDVTAQAGLHFSHQSGAAGKKLLPETMGSGVVVLDIDNDGKQDLAVANVGSNSVSIRLGDGLGGFGGHGLFQCARTWRAR